MTLNNNIFNFIKKADWSEVFLSWKNNEAHQKKWQELYKKRGFSSWSEWRGQYIKPLGLDELTWQVYQIKNPVKNVPEFFGGPFKSWQENFYKNKNSLTFKELANLKEIKNYKGIVDIADNFPRETNLIGLLLKNNIYIIEGMHRCSALALLNNKKNILDLDIKIFLAEYSEDRLPTVGQVDKN